MLAGNFTYQLRQTRFRRALPVSLLLTIGYKQLRSLIVAREM